MERASEFILESESTCPLADIAAYIDGELSPDAELKLEQHLAGCRNCSEELNSQKQFVNTLNGSLSGGFEIPADITKRIVANAESSVSGLRRRSEWLGAFSVCSALLLFVLFALGAGARGALVSFFDLFGQIAAVASFVSHLFYDFAIGVIVILRTIGAQPAFSIFTVGVLAVLAAGALYRFSPLRFNKEKIDQLESGNGF